MNSSLTFVWEYYGKFLKNSKDLKTNACVAPSRQLPKHIRDALKDVHEDVSSRYYGCGLVVPECLETCSILDLGSGSGRDCYMLSKLVGQKGHVTGIDMTDEQVEVSKKYIDYHMQKFGFQPANVDFVQGYIENLHAVQIKDKCYDVIISNCVINLSPDKRAVLKEAYRVLKDGGEIYFSDMYINKALPAELKESKVLWGEGLGGALTWKELFDIAADIGFCTPRLVTARYITVNEELKNIIGDYKFVSATFRLFKVPKDAVKVKCRAVYNGGITGYEQKLELDANITFKVGEAVEIDEELSSILKCSRFVDKFSFQEAGNMPCSGSSHLSKETIRNPFELAEALSNGAQYSCSGDSGCS
uniref:Arsenite methyltransferase n=1 Tax=Xenopus tropicalis TaxID=8364 RepID=A0A6I8RMB6_XENTR